MNTSADNNIELDGFTPVRSKKSRFNALGKDEESAPNAPLKEINNKSIVTKEITQTTPRVLFKRKENQEAPLAPLKVKENIIRDTVSVKNDDVVVPKIFMIRKKQEPAVSISNIKLFPELNGTTIEKPKSTTPWSSFKTTQIDFTKEAPVLPSIVKIASLSSKTVSKTVPVKKVRSSSDDEESYDSYGESNDSYEYNTDEYEETWLETLYYKQNDILEELDELEQNRKVNTRKYRELEMELADVNNDIDTEEYYLQQAENENYERLNQVLLGKFDPLFYEESEVTKKRKEQEKKDEMRERQARIEIIGYDDYDEFQLKLEEDLKKLRRSDPFY